MIGACTLAKRMTIPHVILIGAGGHAAAIVEAVEQIGGKIELIVDPKPVNWLEAPRFESIGGVKPQQGTVALGIGGAATDALEHRLGLLIEMLELGFSADPVIHPDAVVSRSANIGPGVTVLAGAVVQPHTVLERGVLVNTGAIVEHHSTVEEGAHVAPGAIVLGSCRIGRCAMIGAGSAVLQGHSVPEKFTVRAVSLYPNDADA